MTWIKQVSYYATTLMFVILTYGMAIEVGFYEDIHTVGKSNLHF